MAVKPTFFRVSVAAAVALFLFATSTVVIADMFGLFKTYDVHLCPEVKGQLMLKGAPVAGVTVTRSLTFWDEAPRVDTTVSDANGHFSFPEVTIKSKKPGDVLVQEFTAQEIYAELNEEKYKLWRSVLHDFNERPEYKRKLASLNCDLGDKLTKFEFGNEQNPNLMFTAVSLCKWSEDYIFVLEYEEKY